MDEPSEQMMEDAKQVRTYIEKHRGMASRSIVYVVDEDGNRINLRTYRENGPDSPRKYPSAEALEEWRREDLDAS